MGLSSTDYARAVATLDAVAWRGIMPGLEDAALLAALGNPHIGLRGALVAGTNGKGSVCATVDAVCRAAGHRSVLLTSPHLVSTASASSATASRLPKRSSAPWSPRVGDAAEALPEELQPTGFEVLTAAGILAAREADAEVLVCEVGLGGRLDSTNVLDLGVAAVTNVALDHQDLLGATFPEIAREKAAIIKPGNRVVTAPPSRRSARSVPEPLRSAPRSPWWEATSRSPGSGGMSGVAVDTVFDGRPISVRAPLRGDFRSPTSRPRWRSATRSERPDPHRRGAVERGCARSAGPAAWTGSTGRRHPYRWRPQPGGMAAMVASARELIRDRHCVAIFAAMRNKDAVSMAAALSELTREIVVTAPAVERASPPEDLADSSIRPPKSQRT